MVDFKQLGINPLPAGTLGDPMQTWNPADKKSKLPGIDPLKDNSFIKDMETGMTEDNTQVPVTPAVEVPKATTQVPQVPQEPVQPIPQTPVQVAPEAAAPEEQFDTNVLEALNKLPNAPSLAQREAWKREHKEIGAAYFSQEEIYVIRPINRQEWRQLNSEEKIATDPNRLIETIVIKGVLWPALTPEILASGKAGTLDTLHEQIMGISNFIPPQVAIQLVARL